MIQLTFVENLMPVDLSVPEILADKHGIVENASKNSKIQTSFNVLFLHKTA